MEIIKHLLGICGEPHLNLITLIVGTPALMYLAHNLKQLKNGK
jgi:hypothetical protein|tara:strand:+ start:582 stop:710 length:129 start_codon:yes stop_codon:yes gene_type:complete